MLLFVGSRWFVDVAARIDQFIKKVMLQDFSFCIRAAWVSVLFLTRFSFASDLNCFVYDVSVIFAVVTVII